MRGRSILGFGTSSSIEVRIEVFTGRTRGEKSDAGPQLDNSKKIEVVESPCKGTGTARALRHAWSHPAGAGLHKEAHVKLRSQQTSSLPLLRDPLILRTLTSVRRLDGALL